MKAPVTTSLWGIRRNAGFYDLLRRLAIALHQDLIAQRTIQEAAVRHGMKEGTYYRLRVFFREHKETILEAQRTGNWRPVEVILFPELLATYPQCPDYAAACEAAIAALRVRREEKAGRSRRRRRSTAKQLVAWLRQVLGRLQSWLD